MSSKDTETHNGSSSWPRIPLDPDILDWFKARGRGYEHHINSVLREHIFSRASRHPEDDEILKTFVRELKGRLGGHLEQLVLFGSRARGDQRHDSDYDFLAVLDESSRELETAIDEVSGEFLCRHCAVFSVVSVSEEEYRTRPQKPLFVNVRREGISL